MKPSSSGAAVAGEELAHLDYAQETAAKDAALAAFWRQAGLPGKPEPLLASPRARGYRSTSKRRVDFQAGATHLLIGQRKARRGSPAFVASALEPAEHAVIYRLLQGLLCEPAFQVVAKHLNWLVLRGSYAERAVIFNVDTLFGPLVRKLKVLGNRLAAADTAVAAAYVYVDESGSDYYLEARRPARAVDFKRLFGPDSLRVSYGDLRLGFHPTSFCQVNESIVPQMLQLAAEMLEPRASERLIDLYCGFGLFSHALADRVREVVGVDAAGPSIDSARENARRLRHSAARFTAARIGAAAVKRLPETGGDEIVLLDPPRDGAEPGVVAAIAARRPRRVVHVFCSVDEIPAALAEWKSTGYAPGRVAPLDMFPGTPHLEVLVQLVPVAGRGRATRSAG